MKISDVEVLLVTPETARATKRTWTLVVVHTDEGIHGVGESSQPAGGGSVLAGKSLAFVKDSLLGRDPRDIEDIWRMLYRRFTYLGSRGLITRVISGIDIALWDIKGKVLGRPVYDLLGGPVRNEVSLYTHPAGGSPEAIAESAAALVAQGYRALKTDPFAEEMQRYHTGFLSGNISRSGLSRGAAIISTMRQTVGPDVDIMVDAHGHYNVATAIQVGTRLAEYDITWLEEPIPPESVAALRQVKENVPVPICVGERLFTRFDFVPILEGRLAEYIMPDVCWTGGITELKKIASMAEAYYVPISPHNVQSPIQIVAGAHTMRTVNNFYRLEIASLAMPEYYPAFDSALDIRDGALHLSDRAGLGIDLDWEYVRRHSERVEA